MEINKSLISKNFGNIEWEVLVNTITSESVKIDNKDFDTPVNNSITGIQVRVILPDKRVGISSSTSVNNWMNCFTNAYKIAKVSKARKICPSVSLKNSFSKRFSKFHDFTEEKLFESVKLIQTHLDKKSPLLSAGVSKIMKNNEYYNSNNSVIRIEDDAIGTSLGIGNKNIIAEASSSLRTKIPDFKSVVDEAVIHFNNSKKSVKVKSGNYTCLFAHNALATVLSPIISSLYGSSVVEKKSKYSKSIGQQVLSPKISILDNPHHDNIKTLFDSEGNKTHENVFVENGVIKNFLLDSYSSEYLKMYNTFNSNSMLIKPSVSFHNMEIPGNTKLNNMIKSTKKGFLFYDLYPGHTINNITGGFGLNSSNFFYIENGVIKGIVKGGVVSGNSFEIFKNIISISKETRSDLGNYNLGVIKTKADIIV